jgi:serine protease AprX
VRVAWRQPDRLPSCCVAIIVSNYTSAVLRKAVWGFSVALLLILPANGVAGQRHALRKVDRLLSRVSSNDGPVRVIVRFRPDSRVNRRQRLESHAATVLAEHAGVSAVTARIDARRIAELVADPDIESISSDAVVGADAKLTTTSLTISGVKQALGMDNSITGGVAVVAVIDSGIAPSSDFDSRLLASYDFTTGKAGTPVAASDAYGHGTHVAGLIASNGSTSSGAYAGVATGARLISLKVLDRNGAGYTSDVIAALEWVTANGARYGVRVVNLSLGHPIYESATTDPLVQAVERAVRAGFVVVVAAGNNGTNAKTGATGYGGIASPGNAPSAITVGAAITNGTSSRRDDRVASYSSRGPSWYDGIAKPDILAPGHALVSNEASGSTIPLTYPSTIVLNGLTKFLRLNGSSMATAVVSGLVADMLEANHVGAQQRYAALNGNKPGYVPPPFLKPNAVKALLQYSATPLADAAGAPYDALTQGAGLVNGNGAIALAKNVDTTKAAGTFWLTDALLPQTTFGAYSESWSQLVIWGTRLVHGSSLVEINQSSWVDNIVWGTGELDNIVWGTYDSADNIVWGTLSGDSDNIVWGTTSTEIRTDPLWAGNATVEENIVWGTSIGALEWDDNIVWGTGLIGTFDGENIVWGTCDPFENIVWGTLSDDNIVWGTSDLLILFGLVIL